VDNQVIKHITLDCVVYFHLSSWRMRTQGEQIYKRLRFELEAEAVGVPVSVAILENTTVRYLGFGPPLASGLS